MSGTSLDGVDAVVVEFADNSGLDNSRLTAQLIASHWQPYPDPVKATLLDLNQPGNNEIDRAWQLSNQLAACYADSVTHLLNKAGLAARNIRAIGCHGQTVRHHPELGYTVQLGNAALLTELTTIPVVHDFRSRDIAAGGQGAPLVPAYHAGVFAHPDIHRVIVNIGGISNLTDLPPTGVVRGWDCGPGNLLLDAWCQRHFDCAYDRNGTLAASAQSTPELLQSLLSHAFFIRQPPKSCGREDFDLRAAEAALSAGATPAAVLSSLLDLSVSGIANDIRNHCEGAEEVWVCGGGAHNGELLRRLMLGLPACRIGITDALGVPADWVEACAFAWLARQTVQGQSGNLPAVTGARGPRVLGSLTGMAG